MRFIIQLLTVIAIGFVFELFLPWWSVAIAAFIAGFVVRSNANFLAGLLGVALLWLTKAWLIDMSSPSILAEKVADICPLHSKSLLFIVMAIMGGLVGGFAALTGSLIKKKA